MKNNPLEHTFSLGPDAPKQIDLPGYKELTETPEDERNEAVNAVLELSAEQAEQLDVEVLNKIAGNFNFITYADDPEKVAGLIRSFASESDAQKRSVIAQELKAALK